jgi:hypothetical protein
MVLLTIYRVLAGMHLKIYVESLSFLFLIDSKGEDLFLGYCFHCGKFYAGEGTAQSTLKKKRMKNI